VRCRDETRRRDEATRRVPRQFLVEVRARRDDVVVGAPQEVQQVATSTLQLRDLLLDHLGIAPDGALPVPVPAP
jgi:hypothetical protein